MDGILQPAMRANVSRTIETCFRDFLDKEINIAKGIRSVASDSHNHLREFLSDEHARDEHFPVILSDVDSDFLGGSFARHTKNWPLDDIDIYFPIDGAGLIYHSNGYILPYAVQTDDAQQSNPLLVAGERWMTGSLISSRKLIDGFVKVLRRHYPTKTRVRLAGEAVNVKMADLGYDVVPCFSLIPRGSLESAFYVIPDGNDGWIRTNPRIDSDVSVRLQGNNNKTHRAAVKLVKWWNTNRFSGRFDSYYIELAVMRDTNQRNFGGRRDPTITQAVTHAFAAVYGAALQGNQSAWLNHTPPVEAPRLAPAELADVQQAAQCASAAYSWEYQGNAQNAWTLWSGILGPSFPTL